MKRTKPPNTQGTVSCDCQSKANVHTRTSGHKAPYLHFSRGLVSFRDRGLQLGQSKYRVVIKMIRTFLQRSYPLSGIRFTSGQPRRSSSQRERLPKWTHASITARSMSQSKMEEDKGEKGKGRNAGGGGQTTRKSKKYRTKKKRAWWDWESDREDTETKWGAARVKGRQSTEPRTQGWPLGLILHQLCVCVYVGIFRSTAETTYVVYPNLSWQLVCACESYGSPHVYVTYVLCLQKEQHSLSGYCC